MTKEMIKELNEITLKDGRRVFTLGCVVLISMILMHMTALIIVATSTVPRVSKRSLAAYSICMTTAKDVKVQAKCAYPVVNNGKSASAKILDAGPYPWTAVIIFFLFCGIFYIIQSTEDFRRTRDLLGIGASAYSKNAKMPDFLNEETITTIGNKIVEYIGEKNKEPNVVKHKHSATHDNTEKAKKVIEELKKREGTE